MSNGTLSLETDHLFPLSACAQSAVPHSAVVVVHRDPLAARRAGAPGHFTRGRRLGATLGLLLASASFVGCEDKAAPLDEKAATEQAALHAQAVMHESGLALAFTVANDGTLSKIMGSSSATAGAVVAPALSGGMPPTSMLRALVGPELTQQMTGVQLPSMLTTEERFDDAGQELGRLMRERLFVASNLESNENGTATYLLHGDPTCRPLTQDSDPVGSVPPIDQKCADDFSKLDMRIAVRSDGDGSRMTVLVGADRLELVVVLVHSDELALEVDFAKAKAASDLIQRQLGDGSPTDSYVRLTGKVRSSLKKVGAQTVTAAVAILQAIDFAPSSGGSTKIATSNPLFALTSDGLAKTAELQVGIGATDIAKSWDPQNTAVRNEDFHMISAGLYGTVSLQEGAQQVLLTDVGIGATKFTVRGATIVDLNLNPSAMRRFSGKVTTNAGISRLEITPTFDFRLALDYNAIASDFATAPAPEIAHESYAVTVVNGSAPAVIEEAPSSATFAGGLKMVAGSLTIGAASVPDQQVVVPMGRCLSATDVVAPGAHPILGTLIVSDCP